MKKTVKVSKVETLKAGKADRVVLHYELLDGPKKGEVWKIGALFVKLDEASRKKIKAVKSGDVVEIDLLKEGNYWNLKSIGDADSTPKATSTYKPYEKKSSNNDDNLTGIKVGAARNQAIAFLSATKGANFTLDDVDATAYEIIDRQATQEKTVKSGVKPAVEQAQQTNTVSFDTTDIPEDDFGF